jgi:protocatechuate 3,4-dioxygenase beta subunit
LVVSDCAVAGGAPGGAVEPGQSSSERTRTVLTDADGVVVFDAPAGRVVRFVIHRADRSIHRELVVPLTRSTDLGDLVVASEPAPTTAGSSVSGGRSKITRLVQVRDAARRPIPGALVWLESQPSCWGRTDADGNWRLAVPASEAGPLQAAAPGYEESSAEIAANATATAISLTAWPERVRGRVLDAAGRPVPRSLVVLHAFLRSVRTGVDGSFSFDDLPPEIASPEAFIIVRATAAGFSPARVIGRGSGGAVELVLQRPRTVRGQLVDASGIPVERARVTLWSGGRAGDARETDSASGGWFDLPAVAMGRYHLEIVAIGMATIDRLVDVTPGAEPFSLGRVVLSPEVNFDGRLEDTGGHPVRGVSIWVHRQSGGLDWRNRTERRPADATSTSDGTFHVERLDAGSQITLIFRKSGYAPLTAEIKTEPGDADDVFVLTPVGRLVLRVLDAHGQPASEADVMGLPGAVDGSGGFPATDANGELVLDYLPERSYLVSVWRERGLEAWEGRIDIPAAGEEGEREIRLAAAGFLAGRVRDAAGEVIAGAVIWVPGIPLVRDTTTSDGSFLVGPLAAGRISVVVDHPRYEQRRLDLEITPAMAPIDTVLEDRSVLVVGRLEGKQGDGIEITFSPDGVAIRYWSHATTSADGRFDFGRIRPGRYRVSVSAGLLAPGSEFVTIAPEVGLQEVVLSLLDASGSKEVE